jgi:hypothetical protein
LRKRRRKKRSGKEEKKKKKQQKRRKKSRKEEEEKKREEKEKNKKNRFSEQVVLTQFHCMPVFSHDFWCLLRCGEYEFLAHKRIHLAIVVHDSIRSFKFSAIIKITGKNNSRLLLRILGFILYCML